MIVEAQVRMRRKKMFNKSRISSGPASGSSTGPEEILPTWPGLAAYKVEGQVRAAAQVVQIEGSSDGGVCTSVKEGSHRRERFLPI